MDKKLKSSLCREVGTRKNNMKVKSTVLIGCLLLWFVNSAVAQHVPTAIPPNQSASNQVSANETQPLPENPEVAQSSNPATPSQMPVGTAVAPEVPVAGVAVFSPAGAAIAPAKQHRVRTILISLGIVLGTVAAVGTVVALANASPSRPPGAR
jgi:cytoskeletal protein RodZ